MERDRMWKLAAALRDVSAMVQRRVAAAEEDPIAVRVLAFLVAVGRAHPAEVTRELGLSPAATTRRLRGLQQLGQIAIHPDPRDGRAYTVEITAAGRARLTQFADDTATSMGSALDEWAAEDIATLTRLLVRLLESDTLRSGPSMATQDNTPNTAPTKWWRQIDPEDSNE